MASKSNNPKTDPADRKTRVWVIEQRCKGSDKWDTLYIYPQEAAIQEYNVAHRCGQLAEERCGREFRYRHATLNFDDDGRKCVIY